LKYLDFLFNEDRDGEVKIRAIIAKAIFARFDKDLLQQKMFLKLYV